MASYFKSIKLVMSLYVEKKTISLPLDMYR